MSKLVKELNKIEKNRFIFSAPPLFWRWTPHVTKEFRIHGKWYLIRSSLAAIIRHLRHSKYFSKSKPHSSEEKSEITFDIPLALDIQRLSQSYPNYCKNNVHILSKRYISYPMNLLFSLSEKISRKQLRNISSWIFASDGSY